MRRLIHVSKLIAEEILAVRVYVYISGLQCHQYVCHMGGCPRRCFAAGYRTHAQKTATRRVRACVYVTVFVCVRECVWVWVF